MSLRTAYRRLMIDLGTLAGLHEHGHQLAAYCPKCDRWSLLDLAGAIR